MNNKFVKHEILDEELGTVLNTKQVASYLGVDVKTIWQYYDQLGGIRLGKKYIFFERRLIDAIQTQQHLGCLPQADNRGSEIQEGENFQGEKGGDCMGNGHPKINRRGISKPKEKDPYGLLPS
jgi:hypothetical protein